MPALAVDKVSAEVRNSSALAPALTSAPGRMEREQLRKDLP